MKHYIIAALTTAVASTALIITATAEHGLRFGGEWVAAVGIAFFAGVWARWKAKQEQRHDADMPARERDSVVRMPPQAAFAFAERKPVKRFTTFYF